MKRFLAVAALILLSAFALNAQTGTTTITIVAAASLGTITPTPAHFYQNTAAPISLASSTNGFNSSCTATAGTTALPLTYSSTTNALTGTLTAAMTSTLGSLTITITCTPSPLTMNSPVNLPNATVGQAYSASLQTVTGLSGGVPPYTWALTSGSLPQGLALSPSSGIVSGTPSGAGSSTFQFSVTDSSGSAFIVKFKGENA
jgi:large repetitive protein